MFVAAALFALFGFGHHAAATPAPTVFGRAVAAVQGVPVVLWVAVIGVIASIAGPVVQHVLESRRSKHTP